MQSVILATMGSVILVSLISLVGLVGLSISKTLLHKALLLLVSFSAAALLGDVFFHLLPELAQEGFTTSTSLWILSGIVVFFIIEKFICWHHCHTEDNCEKEHHNKSTHKEVHAYAHTILLGDLLHNFIDGIVIGASYLTSIQLGIATTLAVIVHEIPQELGDFGVLIHSGYSTSRALWLNFITALSSVLGGGLVLLIGSSLDGALPALIAFTAGTFIYIASADLIPELHKEVRLSPSLLQLVGFALGLLVMYGLLFIDAA